ncbi:hypothetical protein [Caulobacter phage DCM]|uniref:DUF1737 domain-containing protein n=1 Tax=Caulobacter phage DCM TaxID=3020391 RepID=A0AAF0B8T6_9CAUD|nr:hypothetical protein [Caulobacter phage DCM]WCD56112.1 hypothetical protein [Caulobacter phage BL199]
MDYQLMQDRSADNINQRIKDAAKEGWKLLGPVSAVYVQGDLTWFATMGWADPAKK